MRKQLKILDRVTRISRTREGEEGGKKKNIVDNKPW
jgi:hypothetical protein